MLVQIGKNDIKKKKNLDDNTVLEKILLQIQKNDIKKKIKRYCASNRIT